MKSAVPVDKIGRNLLVALQANPRASIAELSRQIGLSQTRTAERLRHFEEVGVIAGYSVNLDRESLGLPILAYIRLTCPGNKYRSFLEFVRSADDIHECHHLTGGDAFLLRAAVASIEALEHLIEALLPYGEPTTSVVLSSPVPGRPLLLPK